MIGHDDIQDELSARLDGEPGRLNDDVVEAHLAACPQCRAFFDRARRLQEMLGDTAPPPAAEDRTDAILAQVESEWREAASARRAWAVGARALMAVAAVCFAAWAVATVAATGGLTEAGADSGVLAPDAQPELAALLGQAAAVRLATGVALAFAAWRPRIVPGFLVFLCACTMFNLGFAMRDLVLDLAGAPQIAGLVLYAATTLAAGAAWWLDAAPHRGGWRSLGAGPSELG